MLLLFYFKLFLYISRVFLFINILKRLIFRNATFRNATYEYLKMLLFKNYIIGIKIAPYY